MLLYVLLVITTLFIAGLLIKNKLARKFCVLCASISLTWVGLLLLYRLNVFHNQVILALLMGQSITGVFYLVRRQVPKLLRVFTLPFYLSLTVLAYWLIVGITAPLPVLSFLLVLWATAYVIFANRNDPGKKLLADAVMNCCEGE